MLCADRQLSLFGRVITLIVLFRFTFVSINNQNSMKFSQIIFSILLIAGGFLIGKSLTSATSPQESYNSDNQDDGITAAKYVDKSEKEPVLSSRKHTSDIDGAFGPHETAVIDLFESAAPSVVFITTTSLSQRGWSMDITEIPKGTGTGFMWDDQGHIVTNFHVLEGGNKFTVTLADQTSYDAEVVGYEPSKDLAVLKIKSMEKLTALPLSLIHI